MRGNLQTLVLLLMLGLTQANPNKIDALLRSKLVTESKLDILVSMKDGTADVLANIAARSFDTRAERSAAVYNGLRDRAATTQGRLLALLALKPTGTDVSTRSLWISNQIAIPAADSEIINQLAAHEDVSVIYWDEPIYLDAPTDDSGPDHLAGLGRMSLAAEWGVERVNAPQVWSMPGGSNGAGIRIANIDTGVRSTHEILRDNYANDGRAWFDPYRGTQVPADVRGHGTHVMGTIVGANGFGVAPGATWMACKGLNDDGSGASSALIRCGEFLICPTDPNGNNADCSKTPHVVANSWGGPGGRTLYDDMIRAWHAAGIVPVFSGGNSGPGCGTAGGPGDRDVLGIGSTTDTDALSSFSGVGPSMFSTMKPDLSAPGSAVRSADPASDTSYSIKSGTSMACPHVAGAAAILLSRDPRLSYVQIKNVLQVNAERNLTTTGIACGGIRDNVFPNHHFGHGRLDVLKAYQALLRS